MEDQKQKIIQGAFDLFMKYGIRSVTMDEIARHLSISKKTIYQQFKDKGEIVMAFAEKHMEIEQNVFEAIKNDMENAVDEAIKISKWVREVLSSMHASVVFDIRKYYPRVWQRFQQFEDEFLVKAILDNLDRGISEGFYRKEINIEILVKARIKEIETITDPLVFPPEKFQQVEVHLTLLERFMRGILTPKGLILFEKSWELYVPQTIS